MVFMELREHMELMEHLELAGLNRKPKSKYQKK